MLDLLYILRMLYVVCMLHMAVRACAGQPAYCVHDVYCCMLSCLFCACCMNPMHAVHAVNAGHVVHTVHIVFCQALRQQSAFEKVREHCLTF